MRMTISLVPCSTARAITAKFISKLLFGGASRIRQPELAGGGGLDRLLRRTLELRDPLVREPIGAIDLVRCAATGPGGEQGVDVFPNDGAVGSDLKDSAAGTFGDQGVAVGQALRAADVGGKKRGRGVRPNQLESHRIDFEHSRRWPGEDCLS